MRARFAGLPRPFWGLWSAALVNRVGGVVQPFLALYFASRGLDVPTIGVLTAVVGAGGLLSGPVGGVLADRLGRRETFAVGMVGAALALAVLGAADAVWLMAVAGFASGACIDLYRPAASALVADLVPPQDRARAYALMFWVANIGFAVASVLAGHLAARGYGLLFALDAATCLACAALVWRAVPGGRGPTPAAGQGSGSLAEALRDRVLVAFTAATMLLACVYFQAFSTLPLAMRADGLGPATFGTVIAVNGVLIVVLQPLLLPVLARVPRLRLLAGGAALTGAGFGLTGLAPTPAAYALPIAVWTLGEILWSSVAPAVVADLAPEHMRGRYQGTWGLAFGLALALAPLLGAPLLDAAGARALWVTCAAAGAAVAVATAALGPALRARGAA